MKYHVEKSIVINKSVDEISPLISDFHNWVKWSPWNVLEPGCKMEYSGTVGAPSHMMSWEGEFIGSGRQTLVSIVNGKYEYDLEFIKPFKSKSKAGIILESVDGGTKVVWTLDASLPFFLFFMVATMKSWLGMDYDRGLIMLKAVAETGVVGASTVNNGIVDKEGFKYVGIKRTVSMAELAPLMNKDFETLMNELAKRNAQAKHWVTLYPKMDIKNMRMTYIAAISTENLQGVDMGVDFVAGEVEKGKVLEIKHKGSYQFLGNAWSMGMMYTRAKKLKMRSVPYEYYWNNPRDTATADLETSVFFPVK